MGRFFHLQRQFISDAVIMATVDLLLLLTATAGEAFNPYAYENARNNDLRLATLISEPIDYCLASDSRDLYSTREALHS